MSSQQGAALFHTSTTSHNHYQTLEVSQGASQQDIKAQFYKLSKRWHPDVNPDSEDAVKKFQKVSEAYSAIGSESSRKDYDRQMSGSRHGATRGASRGGYRYASENVARRATASYAWDYQRRRAGAKRDDDAQKPKSQYHEFGKGGFDESTQSSMFQKFAERERRKEAAMAARTSANSSKSASSSAGSTNVGGNGFVSKEEHDAQAASPLIRFAQVAGVFYMIFFISTKLGSNTGETRRANSSRYNTSASS